MVEKNNTYNKVVSVIAEALSIEKSDINASKSLEDLGADSLDRLEMIMKFEETFSIDISDEQEANIKTVQDIVDAIDKLRTE